MNIISVRSLDIEARGVGNLTNEDGSIGKVIFVDGALPTEVVEYNPYRKKPSFELALVGKIFKESSQRVSPQCPHFNMCGGCSMQHLEPQAQVAIKQRVLEDNLAHIGKVKPEMMMRPILGPTWAYRYRARLSVRYVLKKAEVLVGFHEKKSRYVADIRSCEILPKHVSDMLMPLRALIASLSVIEALPQIELAVSENIHAKAGENALHTVMVLRIMQALTPDDEQKLRNFADTYQVQFWLQTAGPDSAEAFYPVHKMAHTAFDVGQYLHYRLPEFGITMPFKPTDFTQVNHQINRVMVYRALQLLDIQPQDRVLDLFCGLGNFTLPIATQAQEVMGIEGSKALTDRALENATKNGVAHKTSFETRNLFEITAQDLMALGQFERFLIDPPRDGAMAVCEALSELKRIAPQYLPKRIVYVSCSPSTLARDAGILVNEVSYVMKKAGVINMFPHTSHVESMAVFDLAE